MEIKYGKGAVKTPREIRDKHFRIFAATPAIDWTQPYYVESGFKLIQRDQDGSSSCTAQATMYYCEALEKIERQKDEHYSARYNYSHSFLPGGGAYIWKAMSIPLMFIASADSVPDGVSSEAIMEDSSMNSQAVLEAKTDKYAVIPKSSIDQMAQIVRDYHGFVTGFNGHDGMFAPDGTITDWSRNDWGHAVYVCGYEVRNGKKCLKFKNSWTANWGDGGYGYMPEDFVNSGMMFDCYVYADITDIEQNMTEQEVKQLQALEGYSDPAGVQFWIGKSLADYLKARLIDKIKTIQNSL